MPVGRFDTLDQLDSYLRRFRARHPRLRELQWAGHLHNMHSYRSEEHMVHPLLLSHCDQLRCAILLCCLMHTVHRIIRITMRRQTQTIVVGVQRECHSSAESKMWGWEGADVSCCGSCRILRLTDCSVAATSIAAVGAACPLLEEIRFRGASPSYSAERVSARSELLRHADMMSIVHGTRPIVLVSNRTAACWSCRAGHDLALRPPWLPSLMSRVGNLAFGRLDSCLCRLLNAADGLQVASACTFWTWWPAAAAPLPSASSPTCWKLWLRACRCLRSSHCLASECTNPCRSLICEHDMFIADCIADAYIHQASGTRARILIRIEDMC